MKQQTYGHIIGRYNRVYQAKQTLWDARACANMCVFFARSIGCLEVSQLVSVVLWQPYSLLQDPTLCSLPISPDRKKLSDVKYWWSVAMGLSPLSAGQRQNPPAAGVMVSLPTPCSIAHPTAGTCHVTVRHLHSTACVSGGHARYHSLCYLWEPMRSPGGWQRVGGFFFPATLQPVLYVALNRHRRK